MEVSILNQSGKDTGNKAQLAEDIFGVTPNDHAIYLSVKQYLANQRQGTHKSKERWEIVGSTRKIKKQKGTGTARQGSIKSPLLRGGGRTFGPKPRVYGFKLNKKIKELARNSALSYKATESVISVLDKLELKDAKTSLFVKVLADMGLDKRSLFVISEVDETLIRSSKNISNAVIRVASDLITYDVLNAKRIVILEEALPLIGKKLK